MDHDPATRDAPFTIAVAIATSGRPAILDQTVALLRAQTRGADALLVCPAKPADLAPLPPGERRLFTVVEGPPGLPAQRNALLRAAEGFDVVVFFDDDFFAEPFYLEEVERLFQARSDLAMATGTVVADGILGPGLSPDDARAQLGALGPRPPEALEAVHNGYGCNMSVRLGPVRAHALRFDEALPLYGWLEDVDFSRRLAPFGGIVRSNRLRGVHLGNKGGRSSGVRLGYSQIANPLYMVAKGTLGRKRALAQIARNVAANAAKVWKPEPWVDRRGRLIGNARALRDAARGRLHPRRILDF